MTDFREFLSVHQEGILACGTGALTVSMSLYEGVFCALAWGTMMFIYEGFKSIGK